MTIEELRTERNNRLAACDFYFLTDVAKRIGEGERVALEIYRQNLRDLPARYENQNDITDVNWPIKPL